MSLDLNLLRILRVLLQERSVTRAAARLNLSQPAVSAALNRLRHSLDDPLFVPHGRGITPTPRALEIAGRVDAILNEAEKLTAPQDFDPRAQAARFVIGANDFGLFAVVAPLLERINRASPRTELVVRRLDPEIGRQLSEGDVDVAITLMSTPVSGARVRPLFRETFTGTACRGHPCLETAPDLERFCELGQVRVATADSRLVDPIDEALAELGRRRRIVLTMPSFFLLPAVLSGSSLVAVAPTRLVRQFGDILQPMDLPFELPGFSVNMAWSERTQKSEPHAWLRGEIEAAVSQRH